MIIYIIRRVLIFIPMLLAISFLVYGALELTPGDAVSALINPEVSGRLTEAQFNELREAYGLNKSFLARYGMARQCLSGQFRAFPSGWRTDFDNISGQIACDARAVSGCPFVFHYYGLHPGYI
jgi:hypothetical protein